MASTFKIQDHTLPLSIVLAAILFGGSIVWSTTIYSKVILATAKQAGQVQAAAPAAAQQQAKPAAANVDIKNVKTSGDPFVGKVTAPIVVAYWYDYQCPFCQKAEQNIMAPVIKDYVDTGKIRVVFKDFQFLGADSETLGLASHAVWDTNPAKFYAWHKALFDNQGRENSGWATLDKIKAISSTVLTPAEVDKMAKLMVSNAVAYKAAMSADKTEAGTYGISGTPSFVIGKQLVIGAQPYATVKAAIDAALK